MADEADRAAPTIEAEREAGVRAILAELHADPINVSGRCEDCGDRIGINRLRAKPNARRCIHCQLEHERYEKRGV